MSSSSFSENDIKVDPDKIQVIKDWPRPTTVAEVRSFLGLANYFRKFVQAFGSLAKPLTHLTKQGQKFPKEWSQEAINNFEALMKAALCNAPTLAMPDPVVPYTVICDASDFAIGALLMQNDHPIAYLSRGMNDAQKRYHTTERELLAVVSALKEWRHYLDRPFTVVTDHNPLTFFATKKDLSGRQARWSEYMARFDFTWEYRPGRNNVADPLSCSPVHLKAMLAALRSKARRKPTTSVDKTPRLGAGLAAAIQKGYGSDPAFHPGRIKRSLNP
jgi:hypothetical protein